MEEFSPEQKYAFKRFKDGENLFVTGQAGTGKTFPQKNWWITST
jgi:Lhr-like helicase